MNRIAMGASHELFHFGFRGSVPTTSCAASPKGSLLLLLSRSLGVAGLVAGNTAFSMNAVYSVPMTTKKTVS